MTTAQKIFIVFVITLSMLACGLEQQNGYKELDDGSIEFYYDDQTCVDHHPGNIFYAGQMDCEDNDASSKN